MRQKYCSLVWSNDASPVSANIVILAALISGTVESASSELGPSTPNRCGVVASIFAAAVTALAGSPRVSTPEQATLLLSTPPAALTAVAAARQPAIISGPNAASGPVNGLNAATVSVESFTAPDCADDEHAAAETARTAAAATSARARVRRDLRKVMCGCSHSVPIYVKVLPQMRPIVVYMNALWQTRLPGPLARLTGNPRRQTINPGPSRYVPRARRRPD